VNFLRKKDILVEILVLILFILITPVMLLPFSLNINDAVIDKGDTLINLWTLSWGKHSLLTDPANYFNANILYPERLTLAYSEHQYPTVLLFTLLLLVFRNQVLTYNLIFMLSFILSGYFMYLLVKYITGSRVAGIFSGLFFAFFPYRYHHLPRSQLLSTYWMPLSILYLFKLYEKPSLRKSLLFSLFTSFSLLASFYLGFQLVLTVAILVIVMSIFRQEYLLKKTLHLIISVLVVIVVFLPFVIPYLEVGKQFSDFLRPIETTIAYSAEPALFLQYFEYNWLFNKVLKNALSVILSPGAGFFPGITVLLLSLIGIISVNSKNKTTSKSNKQLNAVRIGFIILLFFSVLMALGPVLKGTSLPEIRLPYYYFYKYFPGFKSMRVPSRFVISTMLSLSILSGLGLNWVKNLFKNVKIKKVSIVIPTLFCVLVLVENFNYPINFERIYTKNDLPQPYELISSSNEDEIVFDPTNPGPLSDYYSTYHFKNVIGGESGYISKVYVDLMSEISDLKSPESFDYLEGAGVTKIVLNMDFFHQRDRTRVENIIKSKFLQSQIKNFNEYKMISIENTGKTINVTNNPLLIEGGMGEINYLKDIEPPLRDFIVFSEFNSGIDLGEEDLSLTQIPIVSLSTGSDYSCRFDTSVAYENAAPNESIKWWITIKNTGYEIWSNTGQHPVELSYHLLDFNSEDELSSGDHTFKLSHPVMPGESVNVYMEFKAPEEPGKYFVALDLLKGKNFWFSKQGSHMLKIPLFVGQSEMPPVRDDTYDVELDNGIVGFAGTGNLKLIEPSNLKYELNLANDSKASIYIRQNKCKKLKLSSIDIDSETYDIKEFEFDGSYFYMVDKVSLNKGRHILVLNQLVKNSKTALLILDKPFDKNWQLYINDKLQKNHINTGFYKNGWLINETGKLNVEFKYSSKWKYLFYLSNLTILGCILFSSIDYLYDLRKRKNQNC